VNVFMLSIRAMTRGYVSPYWMSYRQAAELGGQVRRGETATTVVYYGVAKAKDTDSAGEAHGGENAAEAAPRRFLKWFSAFNADQIEGLPELYHPERDEGEREGPAALPELQAVAEAMTAGISVGYREGGEQACYIRALDEVRMPALRRFGDHERYLATRFHELAHACEHPKRLAVDYGAKIFGNEAYAKGELFAELTAAILGATLGFRPDHLDDHAAYVQFWLKALRGDKRLILKAAGDAQRAVDHLLGAVEAGRAATSSAAAAA
jgi:antirestriction protein ArdC